LPRRYRYPVEETSIEETSEPDEDGYDEDDEDEGDTQDEVEVWGNYLQHFLAEDINSLSSLPSYDSDPEDDPFNSGGEETD